MASACEETETKFIWDKAHGYSTPVDSCLCLSKHKGAPNKPIEIYRWEVNGYNAGSWNGVWELSQSNIDCSNEKWSANNNEVTRLLVTGGAGRFQEYSGPHILHELFVRWKDSSNATKTCSVRVQLVVE